MQMHMEEKHKQRKGRGFALGLALGIPLGLPIGLVMDNLAIGPAIGVAIGAGLGLAMERAYRNREVMETPEMSRKKMIVRAIFIGLLAGGMIALTVTFFIVKGNL